MPIDGLKVGMRKESTASIMEESMIDKRTRLIAGIDSIGSKD